VLVLDLGAAASTSSARRARISLRCYRTPRAMKCFAFFLLMTLAACGGRSVSTNGNGNDSAETGTTGPEEASAYASPEAGVVSSDANQTEDSAVEKPGACTLPAGVTAGNGYPYPEQRCLAQDTGQLCVVTSDATATILLDGAVTGGTKMCSPFCEASEFEMVCESANPDSSLDCQIIPLPTPAGESLYCCACAR
jgi:hypothetical protein